MRIGDVPGAVSASDDCSVEEYGHDKKCNGSRDRSRSLSCFCSWYVRHFSNSRRALIISGTLDAKKMVKNVFSGRSTAAGLLLRALGTCLGWPCLPHAHRSLPVKEKEGSGRRGTPRNRQMYMLLNKLSWWSLLTGCCCCNKANDSSQQFLKELGWCSRRTRTQQVSVEGLCGRKFHYLYTRTNIRN